MQIYGFYCVIVVFGVHGLVSGKTLFERSVKEEDAPSNLDHLHSPVSNGEKAIYHREAPSNREYEEDSDGQPSNYNAKKFINSKEESLSKRSTDTQRNHLRYHNSNKHRRSLYGVVYNQGRPIGILQPISQFYDLQEMSDGENFKSGVVKRELDNKFFHDEEDGDSLASDTAALTDDAQYASKLSNRYGNNKFMETRIPRKSGDDNSKSKRDLSHEQLPQIEENLKQIIKELGLINEDKINKREALTETKQQFVGEDEDLESGLNRIELTKELHPVGRNKKEDQSSKTYNNQHIKQVDSNKNSYNLNSGDSSIHGDKMKKNIITDYRTEGEKFIRKKRQQLNNDIIKGLETSGDLTVSGNRSPLASSTDALVEMDTKQQKSQKNERDEKRDKQAEDSEYEKRLQRNIKNKIAQIKEEVKREVKSMKKSDKNKRDEHSNKKEVNKNRDKRNLLEKETASIRPDVTSNDALKAHVRKRRHALDNNQESDGAEPNNNNRVTWQEINDGEKSDIDKREEEPKKSENSKIHNPHGYEFQRTKRNPITNDRTQRNSPIGHQTGFQAAPNQIAADTHAKHAIVTRGSDHINVPVAGSDPKKIIQINTRNIRQPIKNARPVRAVTPEKRAAGSTNIEIELHKDETNSKDAKRDKIEDIGESYKTPTEVHISKIAQTFSKSSEPVDKIKDVKRSLDTDRYKVFESPVKQVASDISKVVKATDNGINDPPEVDDINRNKRYNDLSSNKEMDSKLVDGSLKRQERKSEPAISLEDMIELDSENSAKRKRRQANYVSREYQKYQEPNNMQIKTYRNDEEEADDDSDEFDDDSFDDRSANLVRKREAYDEYEYDPAEDGQPMRVNKRNTPLRNYMSTVNADVYEAPNYLYGVDGARKKRHAYDLAALHSGGPMLRHFSAVRQRSMQQPIGNFRNKRLEVDPDQKKDQTIGGLSEADIFGGLPQSYEGELNRFKRVKRDM